MFAAISQLPLRKTQKPEQKAKMGRSPVSKHCQNHLIKKLALAKRENRVKKEVKFKTNLTAIWKTLLTVIATSGLLKHDQKFVFTISNTILNGV